jgi:hypothetical protein
MYISLKDSCSKGFNKWADAYQSEMKKDVLTDGGDAVVAADLGLDYRSMKSSGRPHHTALVPGPGTL